MAQQVKIDSEALMAQMQVQIEQAMRQVAQAVNEAPDGQWIAGSEDQVCQIMADLRQQTYQTALQMRADAGEASFPLRPMSAAARPTTRADVRAPC